jgi:transcriptional regulator GlxA family with amidase domain
MHRIAVLLLEGSHASTAIGPMEVFHGAGRLANELRGEASAPEFSVETASAGGRSVRCSGPLTLSPDTDLRDVVDADLVFVPSAGLDLEAALARNSEVIELLREVRTRGGEVAGVCTGVSLLAASGLLDGQIATTHWGVAERYRARFPAVHWRPDRVVTEANGVYCGGGVHAALDLALYLVERHRGRDVALSCARSLLIDMPRDCQAGFAVLPIGDQHADEVIRRCEDWIREHCREEIRFEALAEQLGMSPRNFIRRFKAATGLSPIDYLQRLRVRAARRMLEDGELGVQEVCQRVGYGDAAFFRTVFKRHTGLAPAAYRKRFGASARAIQPS